MGEKEIIALLLARDEKGVEELLTHFSPLMRYIIAPILPSEQDREECLFEAAMKVWEKIEQYSAERGTWKSWLTALTRNTALNYLRRSKSAADGGDISPATPSPEPTPEEACAAAGASGSAERGAVPFVGKRQAHFLSQILLQAVRRADCRRAGADGARG